jgi:hypothetical protein
LLRLERRHSYLELDEVGAVQSRQGVRLKPGRSASCRTRCLGLDATAASPWGFRFGFRSEWSETYHGPPEGGHYRSRRYRSRRADPHPSVTRSCPAASGGRG